MSMPPLRLQTTAAAVLGAALLGGCSSLQNTDSIFGLITPYRIDIVQGNVVTKEQAALLKPGLTRSQVRELLGSPMLTDPFHAQRWDYIFSIRRPGTDAQRRSVVVIFDGDVVKDVQAPELPTEREFVAAIGPKPDRLRAPVLELTEEQRRALPVPPHRDDPAPAPVGPLRDYPPLERP